MRNTVFPKGEILFIIIVQPGERRRRRDAIHLLLIRSTLLWKCQGVFLKLGCPRLRPSVKVKKYGRTFLGIKREHQKGGYRQKSFIFSQKFLCYGQLKDIPSETSYTFFCENWSSNRPNYLFGPCSKKIGLKLPTKAKQI